LLIQLLLLQLLPFRLLVENNPTLSSTISQLASRYELAHEGADSRTLLPEIYSEKDDADLLVQKIPIPETKVCACRNSTQSTQWEPISYIHFRRTFRHHLSWCPQYGITGNSFEMRIAFVPPSWLLAHTLNLSFKLKGWRLSKGVELSPMVIETSRLVNASIPLGFRAVSNARDKLRSTGFADSANCMATLRSILEALLENHKASTLDEDRDGNTLPSIRKGSLISQLTLLTT
jgi:hypothetical protein